MGGDLGGRERERESEREGCSSEEENGGQTFLWAKLQCIIICVFALLVRQCEWPSAVIDDVI